MDRLSRGLEARQLRLCHLSEAYFSWSDRMDSSEVTIKVAYVTIPTFKSYLFYGSGVLSYQRGGSDHPYVPQVSPKCLSDFVVEQAKQVGF